MIVFINKLKTMWVKEAWSRVYVAVFFLIPVPLLIIWLSITYRFPLITYKAQEMSRFFKIKHEIDILKRSLEAESVDVVRKRWEESLAKAPGSYEDMSQLIEGLDSLAYEKGLEMSYTLGKIQPVLNAQAGLSSLPFKVKLKGLRVPGRNLDRIELSVFMNFLREVLETRYGIFLKGISVSGTGYEIREMDVDFEAWVGFVSLAEIS